MAGDPAAVGDWRDAGGYAPLLAGDRACFAWEWLRRTPAYRDAWAGGVVVPEMFGLCRFENPALGAPVARPLWQAALDPAVLCADAVEASSGHRADLFELGTLGALATIIGGGAAAAEHVLLSDGLRSIRLDVLSGTVMAGPVALAWRFSGLESALPSLRALRRLIALTRDRAFARPLHPPERRAARWILMLRVHDARAAGATHREIAGELFRVDVAGPRWRSTAPSARLRVQRLAQGARRALHAGPGYWLGADDTAS